MCKVQWMIGCPKCGSQASPVLYPVPNPPPPPKSGLEMVLNCEQCNPWYGDIRMGKPWKPMEWDDG